MCRAVCAGWGQWHGPPPRRQNGGTGAQLPPFFLSLLPLAALGLPPLPPPVPFPLLCYPVLPLLCFSACMPPASSPPKALFPGGQGMDGAWGGSVSCSTEIREPGPCWMGLWEVSTSSHLPGGLQCLRRGGGVGRARACHTLLLVPLAPETPVRTADRFGVCVLAGGAALRRTLGWRRRSSLLEQGHDPGCPRQQGPITPLQGCDLGLPYVAAGLGALPAPQAVGPGLCSPGQAPAALALHWCGCLS